MKKQLCSVTLAAALGASLAATVEAQSPAPPASVKIGIINIQRAIVESEEGKKAAEKLQAQFTPKRNELQAKQAEIEKLQKQLREQEKTLSDEARANLVRQIESKTKDFTRSNDDATSDFQQAEAQVINEIGQKVFKILEEYARKNAYHVMLDAGSPQSPVLWASAAVDVTDEIIKLYNASQAGTSTPPAASSSTPPAGPPAARPPAAPGSPAARPAAAPGTPAARPAVTPGAPAAKKPATQPR